MLGVWHRPPVTDGSLLYTVRDNGAAFALDLETGAVVYGPERLPAGTYSGPPVLADGHIYVTNEEGLTSVYRAGTKFELVAQNALDGDGLSSIAVSEGQIFLGRRALVGDRQSQEVSSLPRIRLAITWRVLMKPTIALLALFMVACGASRVRDRPHLGADRSWRAEPGRPPRRPGRREGTLHLRERRRVTCRRGLPQYQAAIVFLPGLRDPSTGNPIWTRAGSSVAPRAEPAVSGVLRPRKRRSGVAHCARRRKRGADWNDHPGTTLRAMKRCCRHSPTSARKVSILSWRTFRFFSSGTRWGDAPRTGSAAFMAPVSRGS